MSLAPITDYASLEAAVANYTTRSDLDMGVFIQAAHIRLCREIKSLFLVGANTRTIAPALIVGRYPMAYLYGAICEVARKLQDTEMMATYESLFNREIDEINKFERSQKLGGGPLVPVGSSGLYPP